MKVAAEKQAECAICFEPLLSACVAALWSGGRRVCIHFFHLHCLQDCPAKMGCPLCRVEFKEASPLPPLSRPEMWFEVMDFDRDGQLSQRELFNAVIASLPVDTQALEEMLPAFLVASGKEPDSSLCFSEMFGPEGLLQELQASLMQRQPGVLVSEVPRQQEQQVSCPELHLDKRGWFLHWDTDGSGVLEREEVVRGLAKAFRSDVPAKLCKKRLRMRCIVEQMWAKVDTDGNDRITIDEFCKSCGLADLILEHFRAAEVSKGRRRRTRRKVRRHKPRVEQSWNGADLSDDGENDRPLLLRRPSLGFAHRETVCPKRRTQALFAEAEDNLNGWALNHGASPLPSDQEPLISTSSCRSCSSSTSNSSSSSTCSGGCGSSSGSNLPLPWCDKERAALVHNKVCAHPHALCISEGASTSSIRKIRPRSRAQTVPARTMSEPLRSPSKSAMRRSSTKGSNKKSGCMLADNDSAGSVWLTR